MRGAENDVGAHRSRPPRRRRSRSRASCRCSSTRRAPSSPAATRRARTRSRGSGASSSPRAARDRTGRGAAAAAARIVRGAAASPRPFSTDCPRRSRRGVESRAHTCSSASALARPTAAAVSRRSRAVETGAARPQVQRAGGQDEPGPDGRGDGHHAVRSAGPDRLERRPLPLRRLGLGHRDAPGLVISGRRHDGLVSYTTRPALLVAVRRVTRRRRVAAAPASPDPSLVSVALSKAVGRAPAAGCHVDIPRASDGSVWVESRRRGRDFLGVRTGRRRGGAAPPRAPDRDRGAARADPGPNAGTRSRAWTIRPSTTRF